MFSIALFAFTIVGLIAGSAGGVIYDASARDNYSPPAYWNSRTNRFEPIQPPATTPIEESEEQTTTPPATPQPTQPVTPQTTTPAPVTTAPAPPAAQPAPTTTTKSPPTVQARSVEPAAQQTAPVSSTVSDAAQADTSGEITAMTTAQADGAAEPITYVSQQISTQMRDRLLVLAASALASGAIIFIMSLIGASGATPTFINYRTPVSEVIPR